MQKSNPRKVQEIGINPVMYLSGSAVVKVLDPDGSIAYESKPTKNLVLYGGIVVWITQNPASNTGSSFKENLNACRAGSDATANSTAPDGTFARTGTTVTRSTGTGEFAAGDVGNSIKFSTGEEALITSFTSVTEVETRETGAITATTIVLWKTNQTALGSQLKVDTGVDVALSSATDSNAAGTTTFVQVYNFLAEVGAVTYNEIGLSDGDTDDLYSRVVLTTPVNVAIGQQLQVHYTAIASLGSYLTSTPVTPVVTGWPRPYVITDITHGGTTFDVTFDEDHHYTAGDDVTISNAIPEEIAISTFTSDPTEFIVTTSAAHGLSGTDSIEIVGASVGTYDGTWTVASIDSTTVFRVTSAADPGAATGGTVRQSTPGTYFNGAWVIASNPTTDSIRVTDATIATGAPAGSGDLEGDLAATAAFAGGQTTGIFEDRGGHFLNGITSRQSATRISLGIYSATTPTHVGLGFTPATPDLVSNQDKAWTSDTAEHTFGFESTFSVSEGNSEVVKGFRFYNNQDLVSTSFVVIFDQQQRKDNGYTLEMGFLWTVRPELSQ
tara:strand:- start:9346 stop:11007 length:1662 start_codon:yes stop_codon:yes gene_type:complete